MNSLYKILIPLMFFVQYLGIGAIAQIIIIFFIIIELLRGSKINLSDADNYLFSGVLLIFLFKCFQIPLDVNIHLFKFYWGFTIFYLFFLIVDYRINFIKLFWFAVIVTFLEFVLINTILPLGVLKNIPAAHLEVFSSEIDLGLLKRAYGFANSPTSSSTILVVLVSCVYFFQREKYNDYLTITTAAGLVSLGSGTGFLLYFIFLFIRFKLYQGFKFVIGICLVIFSILFVLNQDIEEGGILMRMSGNYFETLIDLKSFQINEVLNKLDGSYFERFFGASYRLVEESRVMSDFGWIDFLECYGYIGMPFLISFIFLKNRLIILPIVIFLIGYFHYPAIGSVPGQIIFAAVLTYKIEFKHSFSKNVITTKADI